MKQKGKFLTFLFSLFPGAGQMYLGFMKMGGSIMMLFWGIIGFGVLLNLGVLYFQLPVIWCYSFFDAINKNSMDEEEFYMLEDHYLFNMDLSEISALVKGKNKTIFAAILIIIGIAMLISNFMSLLNAILPWELYWRLESILGNIPRIGIALIIIWIGMRMIQGKRLELHPHMKEKVFVRTEPYAQNDGHTKADEQKQEEWTGTVVDLKKESPDNSDSEMKQK